MLTTPLKSPPVRLTFLQLLCRILLIYFVSAVIFGDPDNGDAVGSLPAAKVDIICHAGDNICDGGVVILPAHLNVSFPPSVIFWCQN